MDENKLKVLRTVDFRILPTCGMCRHSEFPSPTEWGTCSINKYEHLKHTGEARDMSIHRAGSCVKFDRDDAALRRLERFSEFF